MTAMNTADPTRWNLRDHRGLSGRDGRLRESAGENHPRRPDDHRSPGSWGRPLGTAGQRWRRGDRAPQATAGRPAPANGRDNGRSRDGRGGRSTLSPELERRLVAAAKEGDSRARAELVDAFLPVISSVARLYRCTPSVDRVELLQEGVVGLLRAVERYDPARGTPFWAYAKWWVRQAMQQLVSELTRPAVLSDRALRQLARVKEARAQALGEYRREPSREELATRADLTLEQVDNLLAIDSVPRSIEDPITGEDGTVGTIGEQFVDPRSEAEYERVLDESERPELAALLAGLSDRERAVLQARYGLDGEQQTLREIGERLGVSAERVRQLEQRALGKLAVAAGVEVACA
jgi:RNA polymerase sigma factor (sigma-70 family)